MPDAGKATANPSPPAVALELGELVDRIGDLPARDPEGGAHGPEVLSASLAMQASELQSSWRHGVDSTALAAQMACLLCDLIRFANLCAVDLVATTEQHLAAEESRASAARPSLRQVL
jgi:hypothetical protein